MNVTSEPRLLRSTGRRLGAMSLAEHRAEFGWLTEADAETLLHEVAASGLTGRGGAAFPAHRKMAGVLTGAKPRIVVGNGAEGEPASAKDKTLLSTQPHLVLDGLQVTARIIAADRAFLYVHDEPWLLATVRHALSERRTAGCDAVEVELVTAPPRFVSGEESAVASRISGGDAVPRSKPPRVFESGAFGRPTLVQNVETLAHLAVIVQNGADEFRQFGPADQPGTMLFTVSGAVQRPGVLEAPIGVSMDELIDGAGGLAGQVQAVLLGGYHGAWVPWPAARDLTMSNAALRPHGLSVGAGVVVLLSTDACGPCEVGRVLAYLARESAGQCGPCVFGLPAVASSYAGLVAGRRTGHHRRRLAELPELLERRGGCHHPDGSLRFLRSADAVFGAQLGTHRQARCSALRRSFVLPVPDAAIRG